jgi:hypothetical protein
MAREGHWSPSEPQAGPRAGARVVLGLLASQQALREFLQHNTVYSTGTHSN